jgi:hypothetical protein
MKPITQILFGGALTLPAIMLAQSFTGHYPIGVEGIKAASAPPAGFYLRDYNLLYYADRINDASGDDLGADLEAFVYANALRPIWISEAKLLGADFGMDAIVPLLYKNIAVGGNRDETFNLGDICVEPVILGWHGQRVDVTLAYGMWMPTGDVDPGTITGGTGQATWTHMITAGSTFFFDTEKTWAISALGRYEISYESTEYDITPGNVLSIEGGLSKTVSPGLDLGVIAYYQAQTTRDAGSDGVASSDDLDSVVAVGPELLWLWKQVGMFVSVRYGYEVMSEDRPQGHTGVITLTKRF